MIGIMQAFDRDHTPPINRLCCERFSATGAEFGGPEDGYGLAAEVEYPLFGEPGEGAGEGLARDARGLGHLLPAKGGLEDHAAFGDPALFREVHGPRGLALPVEGSVGPELQHLGRDGQVLEEPVRETLEELELL